VHPILFEFHGFKLHSYGLLLALAFLIGIQLFVSRGARRGMPEDRLHSLSLLLLVLSVVGGRALFVLTHGAEYARDPLAILRLWEGGLMLYGGYFLAIVGGIVYLRRAGLPVWRVADAAAPSMALGIGLGRIGCYLNGCCYGLPADLPWGVTFPTGSYASYTFPGQALHPSQLYLALSGCALFALLLALDRRPRFDGRLFWSYVLLDAVARFAIDFTRFYDETSFIGRMWGLSFNVNQILSAVLILAAVIMLSRLPRQSAASPDAAAGGENAGSPPDASAEMPPDAAAGPVRPAH
jgi:phosphatidylglycerol:prolipoprotein diacylglycerol transferase